MFSTDGAFWGDSRESGRFGLKFLFHKIIISYDSNSSQGIEAMDYMSVSGCFFPHGVG